MQPQELKWLEENKSHFLSRFEIMKLDPQDQTHQLEILRGAAGQFGQAEIDPEVFETILDFTRRFPALGTAPKAAITLLDESLAHLRLQPGQSRLTKQLVEKIVAEKTGIPLARLSRDEKTKLKNLGAELQKNIIGQEPALQTITNIIQRAALGLKNEDRPKGSFLLLGPSGVGKTETAKILAEQLYGSTQQFLRVDMSEFGESHAVARLLGAPAGYIGFDQGGQLTEHFKNKPYSLLLLDEIEKAHPKIFDIFLQILDDGRVTSGQGQTINFTQSTILATSNLAAAEIVEAFELGRDITAPEFLQTEILPILMRSFRTEFLNRFDAIVIYNPLSPAALLDIALLEIKKIEQRVQKHNIKFAITNEVLATNISRLYDPRLGARPVKRFIEQTCETLITQTLLE